MEFNFEELAKKEVERLVGEKLNKKLHLDIQKELKQHEYKNIIRQHTINEVGKLLQEVNLMEFIDKEKLQQDVTEIISSELLKRMIGAYSHYEDDLDSPWD